MRQPLSGAMLLALLALAISAFAQSPAPSPRKPGANVIFPNLAYSAQGHERQMLELYLPPGPPRPLPVLVWIHGGAWMMGDKYAGRLTSTLTRHGYAVASLNYRFAKDALFPAQIEDCKTAIRWLRAHADEYGLDKNRIGVWGESAGGQLAALLGTLDEETFRTAEFPDESSRVQAVCVLEAPADLTVHAREGNPTRPFIIALLGGTPEAKADLYKRASPVTHASAGDPPFHIVQVERDPTVPKEQSDLLAAALEKAGVPHTLQLLPGDKHTVPLPYPGKPADSIIAFFDQHLKPTPAP